jgi:hypothetical protein
MGRRVVGFEPDGLLVFEHGLLRLPGIQVGARQAEPDDGIVRHQRGDRFELRDPIPLHERVGPGIMASGRRGGPVA